LRLVVLLDFYRSIIAIISSNHPLCLTEWMINERLTIAFSSSTKLHEERRTNEMHPPACWRQKLRLIVFSGWKNRSTPIGPTVISYAETYSFREKRTPRSRFNYRSNVFKLSLRFNAKNLLITEKFLSLRKYIYFLFVKNSDIKKIFRKILATQNNFYSYDIHIYVYGYTHTHRRACVCVYYIYIQGEPF